MEVENIKAMLAHKYNEDKADYPAYIQPKLDGVRCLFTAKGAFSRAGNLKLTYLDLVLLLCRLQIWVENYQRLA